MNAKEPVRVWPKRTNKDTFFTLFFPLIICWIASACVERNEIKLPISKDLIPEGIAVDHGNIYLNCLYGQCIIKLSLKGKNPQDVITSGQQGYLTGFGIETYNGILYAANNGIVNNSYVGQITLFDLESEHLIQTYQIKDSNKLYVNDLVINSDGTIYATNSESNTILTTRLGDSLSIFLQSSDLAYCNGIALDDDGNKLYAASWVHGIRIIDIYSGRVANGSHPASRGIDGLKYYQNSLIGIVNSHPDTTKHGLVRFYLNENKSDIIHQQMLIPFDATFDIPTTFDIYNDEVYFIKNAQVDHFQEGDPPSLLNSEELNEYILLKYKLN